MATMNILLPDKMKDWVEGQTQSGHYSNVSDYVRDLIRHDQERKDKTSHMQTLITEGRESGVSDKSMNEILKQARDMSKSL